MEWAQYIIRSEKDHFVPSVRKEIANSMLAGIFISPSSVGCSVPGYSTWENKRYIRSTARSFPPPHSLVLFFKSISKRIHDRTCGLSVDRTTFTFYRVPIHRLPSETRQGKGKKSIMAATEIVSLILNHLFLFDKSSFLSTRSNVSYYPLSWITRGNARLLVGGLNFSINRTTRRKQREARRRR